MNKFLIIGGGASGMALSVFLGRRGIPVVLFEKNERLGKKLYITGKGRCNFTNSCSREELIKNTVSNPRFLYSSFFSFDSSDTCDFFEGLGVKTKIERGGRAFPQSDHSIDIINALEREIKRLGVEIRLNTPVRAVTIENNRVTGVLLDNNKTYPADFVCIATGGLSYPSTGSTGDGYNFAKNAGLSLTPRRPALVPIEVKENFPGKLQGLSLKNVTFTVRAGEKALYSQMGEMLFTHFGISGPLVLSASSVIGERLEKGELKGFIDLKPALSYEKLDGRLLREFGESTNREFKNAVAPLFPGKLREVMVELSGIHPERRVNTVTREERLSFVHLIKNLEITLTGLRPYNEAVITQGGVDVRDIDPKTMRAKNTKGLYFIGEVLDVDALTGGFNLQIAWSTAYKLAENFQEE